MERKYYIIVALVVTVGLLAIYVFSESQRNQSLNSEMTKCNLLSEESIRLGLSAGLTPMGAEIIDRAAWEWVDCFEIAHQKYANAEQEHRWELKKKFRVGFIEGCKELWTDSLDEYFDCIDNWDMPILGIDYD